MMAGLMALPAIATDAMLPALFDIGRDLGVSHDNDAQLIISMIFIGMAFGQVMFGLLADSFGRKASMLIGAAIFLVGSVVTVLAPSLGWMLAGRIIQGLGLGAPRTVTMAIVRDQYSGRQMAKIVSNIVGVFIFVPMVAPLIGQVILFFAEWRAIFGFILAFGLVVVLWFHFRQQETLTADKRVPFILREVAAATVTVGRHPVVMLYAVCSGLVFSGLLAYLSASSQIFQHLYDTGVWFAFIFGLVALSMGLAAQVNGRLVVRLGMQLICRAALGLVLLVSSLFLLYLAVVDSKPPVGWVIAYMMVIMFAYGGVFGNLNALAMEPLDRGAGIGAMLVGFITTVLSIPIGVLIARQIEASVIPLVAGFLLSSAAVLLIMAYVERWRARLEAVQQEVFCQPE